MKVRVLLGLLGHIKMKTVIGLTGGIGTGKSNISRHYQSIGIEIVDADIIARKVVEPGTPALQEIAERWDDILTPEGTLNRKKLGAIVFGDPDELHILNSITHPAIRVEVQNQIQNCSGNVVIYDAPLLFEMGWEGISVVATCTPEAQLFRVMKRDKCTEEHALQRINAQMPLKEKIALADYIIDTNGPKEETRARAFEVLELVRSVKRTYQSGK